MVQIPPPQPTKEKTTHPGGLFFCCSRGAVRAARAGIELKTIILGAEFSHFCGGPAPFCFLNIRRSSYNCLYSLLGVRYDSIGVNSPHLGQIGGQ